MAVGRDDIYAGRGGEPAVDGSYGRPPQGHRLPQATHLGPVRLQVADLARSLPFYENVLGMRVVERQGARVSLAAHDVDQPREAASPLDTGRVLVELNEVPGSRPAGRPARLGLFHFAILLPDRASLGRFVTHLSDAGIRAGAGDHLVSEAFYLNDPDGLGIEVYADRPRDTWRQVDGELMMGTDPVDVAAVTAAADGQPWAGMPAGTVIGHVHLYVGDLNAAAAYYSDALGFDRTVWSYPGALFFGAAGYHHHVGTNTWAGPGARPAEAGDARLLEWTIELPDDDSVQAVGRSLADAGHATQDSAGGDVVSSDPSGTRVRVRAVDS